MATAFPEQLDKSRTGFGGLERADRSIGSPLLDAFAFWGAPLIALVVLMLVSAVMAALPSDRAAGVAGGMAAAISVLTYAHLIAVVPRAYLNPEVFGAHRFRLTIVPVVVIAALALSPVVLVAGAVLAVLWDVHHSAMQNFGLGRIYDMKAGNDSTVLRRTDLWLAYALYVGPAAAGAAMIVHFQSFAHFGDVGIPLLTRVPVAVEGWAGAIHIGAILFWLGIVGAALFSYRRAAATQGYRISAHKLALLISTGTVSVIAWCFSPPVIAFAVVNLFHAIQYFAIVWVKEGKRISALTPAVRRFALPLFLAACGGFGVVYWMVHSLGPIHAGAWLAPFIACSLLHFWYDAFIWSVRKKLV
jgi:hypothetical protein